MGNYVQQNLGTNEHVVYETKLHWMIFVSLKGLFTLFILPLIEFTTSEFAITNKRVIIKEGLISRRTLEMNLNKIESVNVIQSVLGRLLNYGTIVIVGTGGTKEPFSCICDPLTFRKKFQELQQQ
ncbi:MAG TPA: PH domain-containing protein [Candidatus Hydrogenedens sp.]|nr:PH domain-containing protein [Candidatus Hydrogenedens sp.]